MRAGLSQADSPPPRRRRVIPRVPFVSKFGLICEIEISLDLRLNCVSTVHKA